MVSSSPPLATLHGFTGTPQLFDEIGLRAQHPLWLPGHGPQPDLRASSFDDAVELLAEQLGEYREPPHLLAYSMGARLGLWLSLRFPQLLHSVTLIAPQPGLTTSDERQQRGHWEQEWIDLLDNHGMEAFVERWARLPLFASQAHLPRRVLDLQHTARLSHTPIGLAHALRVCGLAGMPSAWTALPELRVPVQWIVGGQDEKFLRISQQVTDAGAPVVRSILPSAGHNPCLEAPAQVRKSVVEMLQGGASKASALGPDTTEGS